MQATANAVTTSAYATGLTRLNWYDVAAQTAAAALFWWGGSYAMLYINPLLAGVLGLPSLLGFSAAVLIFGLFGLIGTMWALRAAVPFRAGLWAAAVWSAVIALYFYLIERLTLPYSMLVVQAGLAIAGILTGLTLGMALSRKLPDFSRSQAALVGIAWGLGLLLYTPAVNVFDVDAAPTMGILLGGLAVSMVGSGVVFAQVKAALADALPKLSPGMAWLFNPIAAPGTPLVVTEEEIDVPKRKRTPRPLGINWGRSLKLAGVGLATMLLVVGAVRVVMPVRMMLIEPPPIPFVNQADQVQANLNNISSANIQSLGVEQITAPAQPTAQDAFPYYVLLAPQYLYGNDADPWIIPAGTQIHALSQEGSRLIFGTDYQDTNGAQMPYHTVYVDRIQVGYAPGLDSNGINVKGYDTSGTYWVGGETYVGDWGVQYRPVHLVKAWLGAGGWMYLVEDARGTRQTVHQTQLVYKPW